MDFKKTEEQELLLESVREFVNTYFPESYFKECDEKHRYPIEFKKAYLEAGFGLLGAPEEFGGTEVDMLTSVMVTEEVVRLGVPPYVVGGDAFRMDDMQQFGTEQAKKDCMECINEGYPSFVLGFTEPNAGSDGANIMTSYARKNGRVYINGHKTFITHATNTNHILCAARNKDNPKQITLWWVSLKAPGVKVMPISKIGWHMSPSCEVYFDEVEVEESAMIGEEGKGFQYTKANYEGERLMICAQCLGMAQAAFDDAVKYAGQREQFGRIIGDYQLIQEKIVRMAAKLDAMRLMIYKTASDKDSGISIRTSASVLKYFVAMAAWEVADDAMQIMGGIGYTNECRISRLWRDMRVERIAGGTDEIMIHIAGRALIKEYADKR